MKHSKLATAGFLRRGPNLSAVRDKEKGVTNIKSRPACELRLGDTRMSVLQDRKGLQSRSPASRFGDRLLDAIAVGVDSVSWLHIFFFAAAG